MGRPPTPVGSYGKITFVPSNPKRGERVLAKVNFRDYDGMRRPISKFGSSKAEAERRLKAAISQRVAPEQDSQIEPGSRVAKLADKWLAAQLAKPDEELATNTKRIYALAIENYVKPGVGQLRVQEAGTPAVNRALQLIAEKNGPSAAKTARTVFSGVFGLGVRLGALRTNPVREVETISAKPKSKPRALTIDEDERLMDLLRSNEQAVAWDLPDLVEFMLGTAIRIGEACAVGHNGCPGHVDGEEPSLAIGPDDAGVVLVNATMIRKTGAGLMIQHWTKTDAGHRSLALPSFAVRMIERRRTELRLQPPYGLVFGSPRGRLRDPNNTSGDLRLVLDGLECDECEGTGLTPGIMANGKPGLVRCKLGPWSWITSHTFRKTALTRLDDAGISARVAADVAGHANPSMTQNKYFGRGVVSVEAARILDR